MTKQTQQPPSPKPDILSEAMRLSEAGLSIIPVKTDGTKRPAGKWKKYQTEIADQDTVLRWFLNVLFGIAIICGQVSGNLEVLDFDEPEAFPKWKQLVEIEDSELLDRLVIVETPTGGYHVYYRCESPVEGNQPLARREVSKNKLTVLIETRGEGGYVVAPGSPPKTHETNKPYLLKRGDLAEIPVISSGDRSLLVACARSLNEFTKTKDIVHTQSTGEDDNRPGSVFNREATWEEVLEPHGWEWLYEREGVGYWKRPGKLDKGSSATSNFADSDLLRVFSTNAAPLEGGHSYDKFGAYTFLNHGGNFSAAAAELEREGYGQLSSASGQYQATEKGLVYLKPTKDGPVPDRLTNFIARIVKDVVEDDGVEQKRLFEIEAELRGRKYRFTVPENEYESLRWRTKHLGAGAVLYAGSMKKDHTRVAIVELSGEIPEKSVFAHTGWRKIDGSWTYLHSGGGITDEGVTSEEEIALGGNLSKYSLPAPPTGDELREAVRANLRFLELAPDRITYPLYAAIYRSVIGGNDHNLHLVGPTGEGKSELAALAQQHWGAQMDARNLPANWSSTDNALEALAFTAKDAILVIDDFAPAGNGGEVGFWHRKAERVFRAQGNSVGRLRMKSDTSFRPEKPPRGMILSTGEDVPRMQSVRARTLILELSPGDVDFDSKLGRCQEDAGAGYYAQTLAAFIQWLAPQYEELREERESKDSVRSLIDSEPGLHRRSRDIAATLLFGLGHFLLFAKEIGAIDDKELQEHTQRGLAAIKKAAAVQIQHQEASEPTSRFIELLVAALSSGKAHIAAPDGLAPENPGAWGWKPGRRSILDPHGTSNWQAQGECIGWLDGEDLYLEPNASYMAAQRFVRDGGEVLPVNGSTLAKRLNEKGLLKRTDEKRKRLKRRRTLAGKRREVLHLHADALMAPAHGGSNDG